MLIVEQGGIRGMRRYESILCLVSTSRQHIIFMKALGQTQRISICPTVQMCDF